MDPSRNCILVPPLCSVVFLLIIGDIFIIQTDAAFYVEVIQKNTNNAKITLYECNAQYSTNEVVRTADIYIRPTNPQDAVCIEVRNKRTRKNIYSWSDFYMVADTGLEGGKRMYVIIGKKGERAALGAASPNLAISVGVIILKAINDVPWLSDVSQNEVAINYIQSQVIGTPIVRDALDEAKLKEFVLYLTMENYRTVLKPTKEYIERFKLFGEVVEKVVDLYTQNVRDAKQNNVDAQTKKTSEDQVATASRLLILKLIDPCLFMAGTGGVMHMPSVIAASKLAQAQCNLYCLFLAAGFKTQRITSSKCNGNRDRLVYGNCWIYRCYCELQSYMLAIPEPAKVFSMIECSNDLRIKAAAVTLKKPSLALTSSIRQSFSRSKPASFFRNFSKGKSFGKSSPPPSE